MAQSDVDSARDRSERLTFIAQPLEFRTEPEIPQWVYCRALRTLLGFGPGVREALGDGTLYGIRNAFFIGTDLDAVEPSPVELADRHQQYYDMRTRLRDYLPTLVIDGTDGERLHRMTEDGRGNVSMVPAGKPKPRTLAARMDYSIGTGKDAEGNPHFMLFRRIRKLKPSYQSKLDTEGETAFGTWMRGFFRGHFTERLHDLKRLYAGQVTYLESRKAMSSTGALEAVRKAATHAVAKRMGLTKPKRSFKKGKTPVEVAAPTAPRLPPSPEPLPDAIRLAMSEIARKRIAEIERREHEIIEVQVERKRGLDKPVTVTKHRRRPKTPYHEIDLLNRALEQIARRDVSAMFHDYVLIPVATFSKRGLMLSESNEEMPTTPSINP